MGRSTHSKARKRNGARRKAALEPWEVRQTQEIHDELVTRVTAEGEALKVEKRVKAEEPRPRRRARVKVVLADDAKSEKE